MWTTGDFDTARSLQHDDLRFDGPAGAALTAEWYHLRDAKVSSVRAIFDAQPFAAMSEERARH